MELNRCMLRVECYKKTCGDFVNMNCTPDYSGVSSDIINKRDKKIGPFDLESMSDPNSCCNKGGWTIFLVSEFGIATSEDVRPVFILVDHNSKNYEPLLAEHELTSFHPIDQKTVKIHHGTFSFKVPHQSNKVVSQIKHFGKQLRLALYRSSDDMFSKNAFDFDYHQHFYGCPYCIIRGTSIVKTVYLEEVSELGTIDFNMIDEIAENDKMEMDCDFQENDEDMTNTKSSGMAKNTQAKSFDTDGSITNDNWTHYASSQNNQPNNPDKCRYKRYPGLSDNDSGLGTIDLSSNDDTSDQDEDSYNEYIASSGDDISGFKSPSNEAGDDDDDYIQRMKRFDSMIKNTTKKNYPSERFVDLIPGGKEIWSQTSRKSFHYRNVTSTSNSNVSLVEKHKKDFTLMDQNVMVSVEQTNHSLTLPWVQLLLVVPCVALVWLLRYFSSN